MRLNPRLARTLLCLTTLLALTVAISAIPTGSPQDAAVSWVLSLSASQRATFAAPARLDKLPSEYRRAVFSALQSPGEKAAFWQGVLDRYEQTHQIPLQARAELHRVRALLTPQLFSPDSPSRWPGTVASARASITAVLGDEAARQLFSTAGPVSGVTSGLPVAERLLYTWRSNRSVHLATWLAPIVPSLIASPWYCDCNENGECSGYQHCNFSEYCKYASVGCGDWWLEGCASKCTF